MIFSPPDTGHSRLDLWRRTGGLLFDSLGGGGGGTAPVPTTNLVLWLKPDDLVGADGSAVISIPDSSTLGNHATKLGASNPTLKLSAVNGKKALQFTGVGTERLGGATNLVTSLATAFVVMSFTSDSPTYSRGLSVAFSNPTPDGTGSGNRVFAMRYFGAQQVMNYSSGSEIAFAPFPAYNTHMLVCSRFDGVKGYMSVNSDAEVPGLAFPYPFDSHVYAIGGDPSGTTGHKGQIAEVILYNTNLAAPQIAEVKTYLKTRFALP